MESKNNVIIDKIGLKLSFPENWEINNHYNQLEKLIKLNNFTITDIVNAYDQCNNLHILYKYGENILFIYIPTLNGYNATMYFAKFIKQSNITIEDWQKAFINLI